MTTTGAPAQSVRSLVPARLDRLPWSRFHWLVVIALGITWILDGIEVQSASLIASVPAVPDVFDVSASTVSRTATVHLFGEVVGALVFGRLSDRPGRRRRFLVTLGIYLVFNGLAGSGWDIWSFSVLRFPAGLGTGGEYAAINSAIDELIPAKYRGRVDIATKGTHWAGAAIAASAGLVLLDTTLVPTDIGWRISLFVGPLIGVAIWQLREHTTFFGISTGRTAPSSIPFAIWNLAGPLLLGHLFDTLGRRKGISGTHLVPAVLLAVSGYLFWQDGVSATGLTVLWCAVFLLADRRGRRRDRRDRAGGRRGGQVTGGRRHAALRRALRRLTPDPAAAQPTPPRAGRVAGRRWRR